MMDFTTELPTAASEFIRLLCVSMSINKHRQRPFSAALCNDVWLVLNEICCICVQIGNQGDEELLIMHLMA